MDIRTTSTTLTQTHREAGAAVSSPTTIVTATAVLLNPLAGQGLVQDLSTLEQLGNDVAALLVGMATASLASVGYPRRMFAATAGCDRRYKWRPRTHRGSASPPTLERPCVRRSVGALTSSREQRKLLVPEQHHDADRK